MENTISTEEQSVWKKWTTSRDKEAGDILIKRYMPLVTYHVQRIAVGLPKTVSKDDLISLGMFGLYDALKKFDPNRDLKFDTYASFRVRGAIIDGLRKEDWLPRSSREKAKKVEVAIEKLEQKYLRNVSSTEVAKELGIPEDEVVNVVNEGFFANILSIDDYLHDHEDGDNIGIIIKDEKQETPEERILKDELIGQLTDVITELNEKEQLVISLFYKEELTLTEIGQVMGLSTSRISQIHSRALFRLRKILENIVH
ncbi:FliA/WhiG family RNA polymerase sigma factor [Metabacillus fastidiosus]|uniref:RNA polymerase sigma factor n=1 Tax=Metabacillus fastidiosus TaxID=1458 RepID=A0ABU6NWV5_9BACI|nr:FliA/WhiG family RNA polymerase sigma factor [Metabacillus fastidiosus]MEC2076954.1 FliA/WhiG family RNA polymerase sigma factor [Metabacillus fastidiosus]MED4401506.1 FliA/WhiG family RNA polymerase sigma factor [Metabacillus fastidiosus]MED4452925.1 FliA/WhiG family RNA polymerase sigma factor [Metabacillus fastidiosus]MED4463140.1 FliA/WhiG family RNA polymerase sigma factor [Metabacillus fastidiosus]MED4532491.1 FliA/WhiG family RNA polymerase sigma factor [Metabacillus fastidiosus]